MSTPSAYFASFTASSIDGGIAFTWSYVNASIPATITNLCVNISDSDVADAAYEMSYVNIPVYTDTSDGSVPTTYFEVRSISNDGNTYALVNGHTYDATPEITVKNGAVVTVESNKYDFSIMPSGIPPVPYFVLAQTGGTQFTVNLKKDASLNSVPTPLSTFDNYSALLGVYVVFNDGLKIQTEYFPNDASNNIYNNDLVINNVSRRLHEVSIKVANVNGISNLTKPKAIVIKSIPSEAVNFAGKQNIFVDTSANSQLAQNRLTWSTSAFIGDPSLNGYSIYRNNAFLALVTDASAGRAISHNFTYVDSNGLVAGQTYNYTIYSVSSATNIPDNALSTSVSVVAAIPATMKPVSKTPSDGKFTLDVSSNLNGFNANEVTFDVSMNGAITNYAATSFDIAGTNGTKYYFQVRAKSVRTGDSFTTFVSAWTPVAWSMPYAPVENIPALTQTPIDVSSNPLDGRITLSWTAPANASYRDPSFNIAVYGKLAGSVDASYVAVTTTILQTATSYTVEGLTNGTAYTFKVVKRQTLVETGEVQESAGLTVDATPFARPSAATNLVFSDASMAYSFTGSSSNGGLTIDGYELNLFNVSNGLKLAVSSYPINLIARDASGALVTTGTLTGLADGRQYRMEVRPFVTYNSIVIYSSNIISDNAFSTPLALAAPTVENVDNGIPMNGRLKISWVLNQGYDASNVSYDVYRGAAPISGATNLTATSYINTGLTNGNSQTYFVVVKIGGLSSPTSGVATGAGIPFNYAPAVINLLSTVQNNSTVNLSWDDFTQAQITSSGVALSSIQYRVDWTNSDLSGQILGLSSNTTSITGLTSGHIYTVTVSTGVLSAGTVYYNTTSTSSIQITPYNLPSSPVNVVVYPSDSTFLLDCTDAAQVSGLTFKYYRMNYGVNNSNIQLITYSSDIDKTDSLFYQNSLVNGTVYSVKLSLVYWNALNTEIKSTAVTNTVTPLQAPNQPSDINGESIGNNEVVLSWAYDSDVTAYSIYKDNEVLLLHVVPGPSSSINLDVSKYKTTVPNLTAGTTYNFKIVAEQLLQGSTIYVSSQAGYINVTPYSTPSVVRNLTYIPSGSVISLSWDEPSNKGGANTAGNTDLQYSVEIFNASGSQKLGTYAGTADTFLNIQNYVDASSVVQTLSSSVEYRFSVAAFFGVAGSNSTSKGPPTVINTQIKRTINTPVLALSPLDTNANGKQVQLALQLDPSATSYIIEVNRIISNVSGATLSTVNYQGSNGVSGWVVDSSNVAILEDGPNVYNIGADSNNFLNGNTISYRCRVTYTNWSVNYSPVVVSSIQSVVPSGKPIFTTLAFDASKNLTAVYSRNGGAINSVTAIGISNNDNGVQVLTPALVDASNIQQNGTIAQNQQVTLIIPTGAWSYSAEEALVIVAGVNGTVLKAAPASNSFAGLST